MKRKLLLFTAFSVAAICARGDEGAGNAPGEVVSDVEKTTVIAKSSTYSTFSLRANLIHWATLTPDLGVEWRPSRNFGIVAHGTWTHWNWDNHDRRYRLWKAEAEFRRYMGPKRNGYLGVALRGGEFNVRLSSTGRQSDFYGAGLVGGYILNFGNCWALDLGLGAGYNYLRNYQKYSYDGEHNYEKIKRNKCYWGLDHAHVTLMWKIIK